MNRTPARRSTLFLLECIIAILFFIITTTICVSLFAKSHMISKSSEDLTMAVHITSSYIEEFRAGKEFPNELRMYYDDNWEASSEASASHTLTITMTQNSNLMEGHFVMDDIFETSLTTYIGGGES